MAHPNNTCYRVFYNDDKFKIWGIVEAYNVNIYLIEGNDRALVIDTGCGIGNLREFIGMLTNKPLIVVNTHNHMDHTGGNGAFDKIHMLDVEIDNQVPEPESEISDSQKKKGLLWRLNPHDKRPYNFSVDCVTFWPKAPLIPISNGYVFDLGNRPIEVIHTKGHTMGSICLLDKKARVLFTGDTANRGVLIGGMPGQYVSVHKETMEKLLMRSNEFDFLFLGHDVDSAGIDQIEDIISAEQDILDGTAVSRPCDTSWPCRLLYTKGRITVGYDIDSINKASV